MDNSQRQLLEEPFPASLHRTRRGTHGRDLVYVEAHNYIARLNAALKGDWSFEVLEHRVLEAEVVILGKLTAAGVSKTAFGGSTITRGRESGEPVSIGDDLKAAASDSLKKACSLLGIGLDLYLDQTAPPETPAEIPRRPAAASSGRTPGEDNPKLTRRQFQAIQGLVDRAGISEDDLAAWVQRAYGSGVAELDRQQASELISKITRSLGGENGQGGNGKSAAGVA